MATRSEMIEQFEKEHGFKPHLWKCSRPVGHTGKHVLEPVKDYASLSGENCCGLMEMVDYKEDFEPGAVSGDLLETVRILQSLNEEQRKEIQDGLASLKASMPENA